MQWVLALGSFSPTCSCFIFPLGCLALYEGGAPVFSSILLTLHGPGLLPLRLPTQSHLGVRSFRMLCASLLCPFLGGVLSTFCPCASLSPSLLSFRWVRSVYSALVDSHSCLVVLWLQSAPLSPSLASPCIQCGSWPRTGWTVSLAGSLLAPSGSLESFLLFSLPLRVPFAFEIVCLSRMLSGFSILLGLLPPLAFSHSGSSCFTIGWTCCGFSCLFRLLSPNPPLLACPGCVLSLMPFHLSWLLRSSGRSVPSFGGILSLWRGFLLLVAFPLSCLGSLSGFFTRFSQSVDVGLRSSLGQSYSFSASSFPLGYSHCLSQRSAVSFCLRFWFLLLLFRGIVSSRVVATCCLCVLSFRFPGGVHSFSELPVFSARLPVLSFFSAPVSSS